MGVILWEAQLLPRGVGIQILIRRSPGAPTDSFAVRIFDKRLPLRERDIELPGRKLCDRHAALWPFDFVSAGLIGRCSHQEVSRGNHHHLWTIRAVAEYLTWVKRRGRLCIWGLVRNGKKPMLPNREQSNACGLRLPELAEA